LGRGEKMTSGGRQRQVGVGHIVSKLMLQRRKVQAGVAGGRRRVTKQIEDGRLSRKKRATGEPNLRSKNKTN